ncbi:MAG: hypothetical protein KKD18_02960 [Nanoarchaeota archaeon]|nr:hypothetical protein [Nanoarchaeota archaeon]MBU0977350.1 hypothetical protein [Nanoarchaeota archaeon]
MKIEEHEAAYQEHLKNIKRLVEESLEENQRNIAYNISQGSVELFSIFLHRLNLIHSSGDQIDHRIFKSKNLVENKLPPDFPSKEKVLNLMKNIEIERNALCYGNRKPQKRIEAVINHFHELRKIINGELKNAH